MAKSKIKKVLTTTLKILISIAAVAYVYYKIDDDTKADIVEALKKSNLFYLIAAFILFNLSKIISSIRLNRYFKCIKVQLPEGFNLKLYYLGMFYNLFLPGGIGGDGYKVYYLQKHHGGNTKKLIAATLLDRLSGVVVLGFLALILAVVSSLEQLVIAQELILIVLAVLAFPIFWLIHNKFFKDFNPEFIRALIMGFGVQLSQLLCAAFILWAISAQGLFFDYMTLFLISSVVAVLPFTIGGVGARELVMLEGVVLFTSLSAYNAQATAITFSILFFVITAISSLIGIVFSIKLK
ncbi:MAG: lysylphosphatidylglycerol synthase transmembrane domain-containing protein [Bacteroidia bacterium]